MALTQVFPKFTAFEDNVGKDQPVPRVLRAVRSEFRTDGDLGRVIGDVCSSRNLCIEAAPGAGKTVRFPAELAVSTKKLVVHVFPFEALAVSVHRYVVSKVTSVTVSLVLKVEDVWPTEGLVLVSAACVVAKWLDDGYVSMPECYLLHDESHESGAASAALRAFGPTAEGVLSYVALTATPNAEGAREMETPGEVRDMDYAPDAFEDPWSVEEVGAPWEAQVQEGHLLLFEDEEKRASDLVQAYNYNGLKAFRLSARTSAGDVVNVLRQLEGKNITPCVIVADSTYRSGHTFAVSMVVDSGKVRRVVVGEDGRPTYHVRDIYEYERVQSRARGGRLPGLVTEYWRPQAMLKPVMCDLEQTDVEAFALICRYLGYRVPGFASRAKMAEGSVPRDLCRALNEDLPLACIPESRLVQPGAKKREPVVAARTVASLVGGAEVSRQVLPAGAGRSGVLPVHSRGAPVGYGEALDMEGAADVLRGMVQRPDNPAVDAAEYRCAEGVVTQDTACMTFPDGVDSVRRVLARDRTKSIHLGWSSYMRSVAINAMVNAHNVEILEMRAIVQVLARVRGKATTKGDRALRAWASKLAERFGELTSRVETGAGILQILCEDFCSMTPCPGLFNEEENQLVLAMLGEFEGMPDAVVSPAAEEVKRVRAWADSATRAYTSKHSSSLGDVGGCKRVGAPIPAWMQYVTGYSGYSRARIRAAGSSSSGTRRSSDGGG